MIQRKNTIIGYKASDQEVALLEHKVRISGLTRSEFLRRLVEQVEVEPVKIGFGMKNRHDAKVSQAESVTAVAA